jgi:hypothetical protein
MKVIIITIFLHIRVTWPVIDIKLSLHFVPVSLKVRHIGGVEV